MILKIIGKPTSKNSLVIGTKGCVQIINAETGEIVENVVGIKWECAVGDLARAEIKLIGTECEVDRILMKEPTIQNDIKTSIPIGIDGQGIFIDPNIKESEKGISIMKNNISDYLYDRCIGLKGRIRELEHRLDNLEKELKEKNMRGKTFGDLTNNFKVCTCDDISKPCVCGNGLSFIVIKY